MRASLPAFAVVVVSGVAVLTGVSTDLRAALRSTERTEEVRGRAQVSDFVRAHPGTVVPASLPEGTEQVAAVLAEGQPSVDVYRPGDPVVTVCTGSARGCMAALPGSALLREGTVAGRHFVALANRSEEPGAGPELTPGGRSFWSGTPFTVDADWTRPR